MADIDTEHSFIKNINSLAAKLDIIIDSNDIFDEGVIPVLEEIASLNLEEAIVDLRKGNYLGNRKIDINLALNMQGITQDLIDTDPDAAEVIWVDTSKTVLYDKAICTFVDGTVIELPFLFDGNPVTVSTHGDLITQFKRLDYAYAQPQVDSVYQFTVADSDNYVLTIDNVAYTYVSGVGATRETIIAGIANMINSNSIPITANVTATSVELTADVAGNPFYLTVSSNLQSTTIAANIIEGPKETEFLAKLVSTSAANFATDVVGEFVRFYDVVGENSNLERIQLHAISGNYVNENPIYFWAKTTSAFQTLAMRAGDVIKLGNEIDKLILLANSIGEVRALQERLPELVDSYDAYGNPLGENTIYNNLDELMEVHSKLLEISTVYDDIRATGNQYIFTVGEDLQLVNSPIKEVASNLQTTNTVGLVGTYITNVNTVATDIINVNTVATDIADVNTVAANIIDIQNAEENADTAIAQASIATTQADIATSQAGIATTQAGIATTNSNEIKNVSVGSTITGAAGTNASVFYNPTDGKFTFVVPQGVKGDRGEAFQVNAVGLIAGRSIYDGQVAGFSFLAIDEATIYFKLSNTSGDWSVGAPFGKGDKGDTGDTGNGITQITFTSTTDISGLAAQSGATDTYTITYSDTTADTIQVYNGLDSALQSVAGRVGNVVLTEADITDLDKYTKAEIDSVLAQVGTIDEFEGALV